MILKIKVQFANAS